METMEELQQRCHSCHNCPLCETRTNLVFGTGSTHSSLMLIGEGPGEQEDLQGEPFVGPAGKLLDTMLELIDLKRSDLYIANIVKCRPPHNRDPKPEEQAACSPWLEQQIEIIDPKLVVFLGRIAACRFLGEDFRITRDHGKWYSLGSRKALAIYHPSALLRDPSKRPETFVDLKTIQRELKNLNA